MVWQVTGDAILLLLCLLLLKLFPTVGSDWFKEALQDLDDMRRHFMGNHHIKGRAATAALSTASPAANPTVATGLHSLRC